MNSMLLTCLSLTVLASLVNGQCSDCDYGARFSVSGGPFTTSFDDLTALSSALSGIGLLTGTVITSASDACNVHNVCGDNSTCTVVTANIINCTCDTGYNATKTSTSFTCNDIDECLNSSVCHANAHCNNTDGSYVCGCNPGYAGDGVTSCTDIDECLSNPCTHTCVDGINNYTCVCNSGFSGDGVNCTDIDECASNPCDVNASCNNTVGSHICLCNTNFTGNGVNCTDVDECALNTDDCIVNATCINVVNGWDCVCNASFTGDGYTCTEIDQCLSNPCHSNANCTDQTYGFDCTCNAGYTGDGFNCTDIDDCNSTSCSANATCTDGINSFTCACDTGFTGDAYTNCTDINECTITGSCGANANCSNTVGSHTCTCNSGFVGDPYVRCDNRMNHTINFFILCTSHPYVADLSNSTTSAYMTLSSALQTQIDSVITTLDSAASVNCQYVFTNETNNETLSAISCFVMNTVENSTIVDRALGGVTETSVCGAQTSADECTNGQNNCASGQTCADTPYGFCCNRELDHRSTGTLNLTFALNYSISGTPDHTNLHAALEAFSKTAISTIEIRGCPSTVTGSLEFAKNGSTIYVFRLTIINATYTVDDVTAALSTLSASASTNILGGNFISMKDYDECADDFANLRDCSAFATCLNSNGSFSCECNSTHYDNSTGTGKICINPVIVSCTADSMKAVVLRDYYDNLGVNLDHLHLLDLNCNRSTHSVDVNDTLEFNFNNTECSTNTTSNSTHVILSNEINNVIPSLPFTGPSITVPVECVYLKTANVSYNLTGAIDTIPLPPTQSVGQFNLVFALYDATYTTQNSAGQLYLSTDTIYARIYILNQISSASVKVDRCWATAYPQQTSLPSSTFINDTCSTDDVVEVTIIQNGNGDARFSHQVFFWPITSRSYIHCSVEICAGTCPNMPTCPSKRRKRDTEDESDGENKIEATGTVTIVIQQNPNDEVIPINDITNVIHTNNVTITVIASILGLVLIILLAVIVVFVCRKSRSRKEDYELHQVNMHAIDKPPTYA